MINGIENQYLSNNIDQNYYCSDYCNINVHKCGVKCGTSLRFWENKGWMNSMDPYGWFHGILDISQVEDLQMMKDKLIDGKEL